MPLASKRHYGVIVVLPISKGSMVGPCWNFPRTALFLLDRQKNFVPKMSCLHWKGCLDNYIKLSTGSVAKPKST